MMHTLTLTLPNDTDVVFQRTFDAPRALVFEALTSPAIQKRWLEAPGRKLEVCESDLRVGGAYRSVWRGPGKKDVALHGVFVELAPPVRIVRTERWEDWDPGEALITTELTEARGLTSMTITVRFASKAVRDEIFRSGMEQGAKDTYDRLERVLARRKERTLVLKAEGEREIVMIRRFDAPRTLVWDAWTKPELVRQWLGLFHGWAFETCELDFRVGGSARLVWRGPEGRHLGMRMHFTQIAAPERFEFSETFDEAWYEGTAHNVIALEERDGVTTLVNTVRYDSKRARDAVLRTPMEEGVAAGYDNLETLLLR